MISNIIPQGTSKRKKNQPLNKENVYSALAKYMYLYPTACYMKVFHVSFDLTVTEQCQ